MICSGESLDRGDLLTLNECEVGLAGPDCLSVHDYSARPAQADTTAVLCARQLEIGAQHPEQAPVRIGVQLNRRAIQCEPDRHFASPSPLSCGRSVDRPRVAVATPAGRRDAIPVHLMEHAARHAASPWRIPLARELLPKGD